MKKLSMLALFAILLFSLGTSLVSADESYIDVEIAYPEDFITESEAADEPAPENEAEKPFDSGVWNGNIVWELFEDGRLEISGNGAFPDDSIPPWSQYYYSDLRSVTISEGITYIGELAFAECYNLDIIYIPDSVEYISESAFVGCETDGLLTISCSEGSYAERYALEHGLRLESEHYDLYIDSGAFDDIHWELSIDGCLYINGIGDIPDYIYELAPWYGYADYVKKVYISDGITGIGEFAFQYCTNLEKIHIPDSVNKISESAFFDLDFQRIMIYCEENTVAEAFSTAYAIPAEVTRYETSGKCGDYIEWSFSDQVLTLSGSGKMYDLPVFDVKFDKVEKIVVGDGITYIGEEAFCGFCNVREAVLADSVEKIGDSAFWCCETLEKITLPEDLSEIGDYAFTEAYSLKNITLPEKLEKIGSSAFGFCLSLEEIVIPKNVERIDEAAFYGCTKLEKIYILSYIRRLGEDAFSNCSDRLVIYAPENSKAEKYAEEYGIGFEPIVVETEKDETETAVVIKPRLPLRGMTEAEKVLDFIAHNIILVLCVLCILVAGVIAIIILVKIKSVKKAKTIKSKDETKE